MDLSDLITPDRVFKGLKVPNRKKLLLELADIAAEHTGLSDRIIYEALEERERLGPTGIGQGIAIPHAKLEGLETVTAVFATLTTPIDFEAIDEQPVDLVFLLLAPKDSSAEHLKALARVSRLMRNQAICEKLRAATDAAALYAILTEPAASNAA